MITVLFHMSIKPERQDEFRKMAGAMTAATHEKDAGCVAYTFLQQANDANRAVLFEQWSDQESLNNHVARLVQDMGPPEQDESLPATHPRRRLPESFMSLFSETDAIRYEAVSWLRLGND